MAPMSYEVDKRFASSVLAAKIALFYALVAGAWVVLSDSAIEILARDPHELTALQNWKGWLFVAITALILFALVRSVLSAVHASELKVRASEARYRNLFEANPQPMWVYDLESLRFLAVNDAAVAHYGYSEVEFLAMNLADIGPKEDVPALLAKVANGTQGLHRAGVWRHRKKDGGLIDVEIVSHTLQFAGRRAELVLALDVTAQRQMQARLAESEGRLRLAAAAANQGLWDFDIAASTVSANAQYALMLGCEPAEFVESFHAWTQRLHPDDRDEVLQTYRDYVEGRLREYRSEFRMRHSDGHWIWVLSIGKITERDAKGKPRRMLGSHTDISANKAAEQRIRRLADLYAALSETNQAIVRETDRDRLFQSICRIAVDYGAMKAAWIGMVSPDGGRIIPIASHGAGLERLERSEIAITPSAPTACAPASIAFHTGQRFLSNDLANDEEIGPWREAASVRGLGAAAALPLRCEGRVVGSFSVYAAEAGFFDDELLGLLDEMAVDISFALDNFVRESARTAAAEALRASEERFRELLQSLDDVVWSYTLNSRTLYLNDAASAVYGRPRQELIEKPALWLGAVHPDDAAGVRTASERLLATGRAEGEYRIVRPDGEIRWLNDRATVIRNDAGETIRFAGVATDVTVRKQAEQALREANRLTQEIIGSVQEGIVVFDLDERYASWNPYMERVSGIPAEQVLGRQALEPILHFADDDASDARHRALEGEIVVLQDKFYDNPDSGKSGYLSAVFAPLRDAAGHTIGAIVTATETSERKRSEEQLRLLSKAVEQSPASILIADSTGTIEYVNPKFCELTGYTAEEAIGRNPRILASGEIPAGEYAELWNTITAGKTWHGVFHNRRKNAELYWEEASISPMFDAEGRITHFVAAMENITERRQAESALREGRALLRTIIDTVPLWISYLDRDGRYVVANRRYSETFGKSTSEIEGAHFSEVLPAAVFERQRPLFEECVQGKVVSFTEESSVAGQQIYAQGVLVPMLDEQERVKGVVVAVTDITELRRSEERLLASEARLNEAQHLAHIGSWELDIANDHLDWSDETYQIFETDRHVFGGTFEAFIDLVHPDDRDLVRQVYTASIEKDPSYELVHRLLTRDGRVKYLLERCRTIYSEDGTPLRSLGSVQDITAVKQAEQQIRALNEQLERRVQERTAELENANRELESFSYSVSHDLRAPLRAIDGFSAIIEREHAADLNEDARHMLNRVRLAVQRMGRLIDDLLGLSRLSRSALNRAPTNLSALAAEIVAELREGAPNSRVAVKLQADLVADADANLIRIALQNLLGNAWKFSSKRTAARIEFGTTTLDGKACYFVRDNGAGFDMRYAGKLFGPFQRLHGETEFAGTGIGLATVQRIIHRHGGRIWTEAAVNEGATFYFTLGA